MSTYLEPILSHLGIYLDAKGFAITRFSYDGKSYQIDEMVISKKLSLELFLVQCENLKPVESAYVNNSKLALHGLSESNLKMIVTEIPEQYDKEAGINLKDTHEILSALLTDKKITIAETFAKSLAGDLTRYEIGDKSHSVLSLFYGIGIHCIHRQKNARNKKSYTTGQVYQGYSIAYW
jgi:hypothetical protein